jgi:hypothetical protein
MLKGFFIMGHYVKSTDGYDVKVPSQGEVTYGTVAGSLGLASFLGLGANGNGNGILGNLFGNRNGCCSEDHCVNRYELAMEKELAAKDSKIALLESTIFTDKKSLELYQYIDGQLKEVREFICEQKVRNQGNGDAIRELDRKIDSAVALEAERRCCADQRIVAYVNGTFAPKAVADFTAATTSTPLTTYNPLCCECGQ